MNLYQEIAQYKEKSEALQKLRNELEGYIQKKFVNVPTKIKQVEVRYDDGEGEEKTLNYPFLRVPSGFKKQEERIYRQFQNCLINEYCLVSEDLTIKVKEFSKFNPLQAETAESYFIEYTVNVNGEEFHYGRQINMLKRKCG